MDPQDFPPIRQAISNPLANANPNAQLVCDIRRHPIGIAWVYAGAAALIIAMAVLIFAVAPGVFANYGHSQTSIIGGLIFAIIAIITLGFVLVAHKVYWGNHWVVSTESITQVTKNSLFNKQTSQLSFANLEDLTAAQRGMISRIFNYGTLSAETAAATDKFIFPFCPNPTYYAQQILAARDRFDANRQATQPATQSYVQPAPPATPPPAPTETGYSVPD